MAQNKIKFRLQGHEKFALREGWLSKGLTVIKEDPMVFRSKIAPDIFGIGNNMVKSLRYWMKAFGLMREENECGAILTSLGEIIYDNDVYIEDIFTVWTLHSYIAKNIEEATTWYMYFNRCDVRDLNKEQIELIIGREISKYVNGQTFSEQSLKNDIDVLLNMYSRNREVSDPEDKNISPFSQLDIIKNIDGLYTKNHPDRRKINAWNILYELAVIMDGIDSVSIEKVIIGEKSISSIYHLTNVVVNQLLDNLDSLGYIRVDRTAGLDMIYRMKDFTPESVMRDYYKK